MNNQGCTVTILRPKETGYLTCNSQPEHYNARIDDWLDFFREQLEIVAEKHRVPIHLRCHQLTAILPDHRKKRWIGESDILTVVNPEDELIEEVERWMRRNPILRTIIGFSSVVDRDALIDFFRKFQIQLLQSRTTVSRIFTVQVQKEERIPSVITRALLYPHPPTTLPTAISHEG
ncbi:hypothetical protein A3H22_00640 [Candidatus Peribacteria bacterium RIFCSPLOWO2_12_FULL_55_15]|nr:MAG: hypothetical protein A2789_02740 [Candidatus Peribacteria bacterium RIFCSPHIGHO2_01_FULL_54_22]OGJ62549.1 MAG: hypothetical protein A3D12_02470 [Candidatus Peribacteria bacterium RIFCSPHIGHO2_02_FULL_55_24]OGJ69102.1 MAG: hypothetical protein A2947_02515 [Candidatus Peribacteria bacterium RIFCSPLOWO2_01_FULL_54_110]OGJ69684.1 MAG: hypothetical protein A3H90_01265 [Candidatus Peribacteria bacterium RIFCSPLOWO2_02_FULL_55_36]OGJ70392.1 MAG: hypothetical protein A3H22_00640 [Candidatus Per